MSTHNMFTTARVKKMLQHRRITQQPGLATLQPTRYRHYHAQDLPPRRTDPAVTLPRVRWLKRPHPWADLSGEKENPPAD